MGIIFAFIAMIAWGLGDFLIQKSVRKFGTLTKKLSNLFFNRGDEKFSNWIVLFYITLFGAIIILPFVVQEIKLLDLTQFLLLSLVSLIILVAAWFDFQALKIGKISVVEPIFTLEIPITIILTSVIISEFLNSWQYLLLTGLALGIILISLKDFSAFKKTIWERGIILAIIAAVAMGATNFLVGLGARATSPLMTNWFLSTFIAIVSFSYLIFNGKLKITADYLKENKKLILSTCFFDNLAWVAYAYSMVYLPIAIATGVSESYIALAAILGLIFNKEKLKIHQIVGLVLTVLTAITLAIMMER